MPREWTKERFADEKAECKRQGEEGIDAQWVWQLATDALDQIEQLTAALKRQTERAEAAEAKLRRYEGGSCAGMLDRS